MYCKIYYTIVCMSGSVLMHISSCSLTDVTSKRIVGGVSTVYLINSLNLLPY